MGAILLAFLLGAAVPVALFVREHRDMSLVDLEAMVLRLSSLADIEDEDISRSLPPLEAFSDPGTGRRGIPTKGGVLRRPAGTIVIGWEGALVDTVYVPKRGRVTLPRPGFSRFLLACADANVEVVVWSTELPATSVLAQLDDLVASTVLPADKERLDAFNKYLDESYDKARAMEVAEAYRAGRAPRTLPLLTVEERRDLYRTSVLRVAAVLGREHCRRREGGAGPEALYVRPAYLVVPRREVGGVLAVTTTTATTAAGSTAAHGDGNTLLEAPGTGDAIEEGLQKKAHGAMPFPIPEWRASAGVVGGGGGGETDPSLFLLAGLVDRLEDWRQQVEKEGKVPKQAGAAQPPLLDGEQPASLRRFVWALAGKEGRTKGKGPAARAGKGHGADAEAAEVGRAALLHISRQLLEEARAGAEGGGLGTKTP